jgi:hypothetical protein
MLILLAEFFLLDFFLGELPFIAKDSILRPLSVAVVTLNPNFLFNI